MRQKIAIITLGVADLERAINFYEKGLGWKRSSFSTGDLVIFNVGGVLLALYPRKGLAEDAMVDERGSGFSGITLSHLANSEAEVEQILSEVEKLGATIVKPAQKVFWGGYNGYFKDLDGYLFEVAYNPFWELTEEGVLKQLL